MTNDPRYRKPHEPEPTPLWPEVDWVRADAPLKPPELGTWYQSVKPSFDFFLALALALPAIPFVIAGWILIKLTSRGPGFYWQTRRGLHGRNYRIFKLRSMRHNAEKATGPQWSHGNDPRIFWVGKMLRKTHLDEIPQLLNVLRGEMSLVGPRPERPEVIEQKCLEEHVPGYALRTVLPPGVTGLAQVQLPADSDLVSVRHKVCYDLYYIHHRTLWLDLRIALATLFKTMGFGPKWLRRLFFLPTRERVVAEFLALLHPEILDGSNENLQPAAYGA